LSWPGLIAKRMFGFRALYRGKKIFAALPHSRGFGSEASILLKSDPLPPALLQRARSDGRLHSNSPGKGWLSFTLSSDTDLHDALEWLNHSYESAKRTRGDRLASAPGEADRGDVTFPKRRFLIVVNFSAPVR